MSDEIKSGSTGGEVGSPNNLDNLVQNPQVDPNAVAPLGQSTENKTQPQIKTNEEFVPKKQYDELESKLGEQGNQLGEFRKFYDDISPLLEKLDSQPELVKAIIDGSINSDLVKSVLENKVSVDDAKTVSEAHKEVKKELGKEGYDKSTPEDIEKLVMEKISKGVSEVESKVTKIISDNEETRRFEQRITSFINSTPDFTEYADKIDKWLNEHPDVFDIEVAYQAVKGIVLSEKQKKEDDIKAGEIAKEVASNVSLGGSTSTTIVKDKNLVDELISPRSNPNAL